MAGRPRDGRDRLGGRGFFTDQFGVDQLGEVLPDGVVVQTETIGELGDVDRAVGVGQVTEDLMPRRMAERPRLLLQRHGHKILR